MSLKSKIQHLVGTASQLFQIGLGGVKLKNVSGNLQVRNAADNAYADIKAKDITADNSIITDTISEKTSNTGVSIDGVLIKDGLVDGIDVSTVPTMISDAIGELAAGLIYKGALNASTLGTQLDNASKGDFYKVSVAGTILTSLELAIGDMVIVNKDVTGTPTLSDLDKIENTEAPDILRIGDLTSAQIFVGNEDDEATAVDVTGDVTISNTGVTAIGENKVTAAMLNADVVSDGLKQNVDGSLSPDTDDTNIGLNATTKKIEIIDASIGNSKIASDAAIEWSKIDKNDSSLADLETRAYSDLTDRPADDDFNSLDAITSSENADTILVYDNSGTAYKKITKGNLMTGIMKAIEVPVGTSSVNSSTVIPANAKVVRVISDIETAYSANATIQVLVNGSTPLEVQPTSNVLATEVAIYESNPEETVSSDNSGVVRVVVGGSPIAGASKIRVEYFESFLA